VVFQPHLYSRTAHFAEGFARALAQADLSLVAPVYPARETPDQGATSDAIVSRAPAGSRLELVSGREAAWNGMSRLLPDGNWVILFVGAGDVGSWALPFAEGRA
jgi:UDP-N-acetylmuramate--alanine ligase